MNRKTNDRSVLKIYPGLATSDGAGVRLTRYIGSPQLDHLDPFLLLDFFQSDNPDDCIAGFPSHPHRGFETVTYLLADRVRHDDNAGHAGVIAGDTSLGTQGPVRDVATRPIYLDITLPPGQSFYEPVPTDYAAFVFVIDGPLRICGGSTEKDMLMAAKQLATLRPGDRVHLAAENSRARCLLICGQPLKEPMVRYGPFVMNTREEVLKAARDFHSGNF